MLGPLTADRGRPGVSWKAEIEEMTVNPSMIAKDQLASASQVQSSGANVEVKRQIR